MKNGANITEVAQIKKLAKAGFSNRNISVSLNISEACVKRFVDHFIKTITDFLGKPEPKDKKGVKNGNAK